MEFSTGDGIFFSRTHIKIRHCIFSEASRAFLNIIVFCEDCMFV